MKYYEHPADTPLNDYVKCFWTLERFYSSDQPYEEVLPDSYFELIINFGEPYYIITGNLKKYLPNCFLLGLLSKPYLLYSDKQVNIVAARLYPWAAKQIFGDGIKHCNDDYLDASSFVSDVNVAGQAKTEILAAVADKLISEIIKSQFEKSTVEAATQLLYQNKGVFKVSALAGLLYTNSRSLQQKFQNDYGISAKLLAKNFRFDKIKKTLSQNPDTNLKELAYDYGYTDQAHFTKDFKSFTNMTPGAFCRKIKGKK
jgi:AraC-like DNA-binding protein